jgi:septal ring factor EnvC (AmiA/AmiB activator)
MPKDKQEITSGDVLEVLQGFIQQNAEHLERMEKNIRKDIEKVEEKLSARIDKVEEGLSDVKDELVSLGNKTERLERKMETIANALSERMGEQEKEIRRVKVKAGMIA